ncbi:MAG TPA: tripartite tricarboxylate transporter substrate binding protein [Ideonella sp.]|uniref:Bug family tripartite tricarboxylate transporter substrate binding protein n=1 Tax=Ideonella sp. TaxID=1929293 RepID=UPI002CA449B5|nr:tripartite tricarboxylate transporter substrate binding protein [Ideonella sp.]HSI49413.1 tripartite tricarboxylate transporter substrate binding protein [Ideonella sp.]
MAPEMRGLTRRHLLAVLAAVPTLAAAQGKPIRLVVPYPPGGPLDLMARALADKVQPALGTIVVDNRAGAGGNLGADVVAKAAPDGLTIGIGAVATHAINPWLYRKMPYDALRDFTPITGLAQMPNVLVMNAERAAQLKISSVAHLVAYAKAHPGQLNYASGGNGSAGHLAGEMLKTQAGLFMVHIPYAGGNPAQLALLSGQVDLSFDNLATASANIRAGKLKALAVTSARRSNAMPELPTVAEAGAKLGLARFDIGTWVGLFGPAKLPADVTARLNKAFTEALATPEIQARWRTLMADSFATTPEQFARFVAAEHTRYQAVVKASGATID